MTSNREDEIRCFKYSIEIAYEHFRNGVFWKAAVHLENAKRSAEVLQHSKDINQFPFTRLKR